MMIGETRRPNPTLLDFYDHPMVNIASPFSFNGEKCCLPSNVGSTEMEESDIPLDAFTCDHFRMYDFKVRRCARARSHDWTECPYAHPGEKARRRDPRKFHYSGTPCPDFRKGQCVRGDGCEYAHGVFECWLHPARYRTQPCKDGTFCRRKICFFAHTSDQLRLLPPSSPGSHAGVLTEPYAGSPSRLGLNLLTRTSAFGLSPTSTLYSPPSSPPNESPPMSPCGFNSLSVSMRCMQIRRSMSPPSWGVQMGGSYGSPRHTSTLRPGFFSVPITPTRSGLGVLDLWDQEEPAMERVESGRDLRTKMYAKLSKENSLVRVDSPVTVPDVGWVSELVR